MLLPKKLATTGTPLNKTANASLRLVPLMMTAAPTGPLAGEIPVMVGVSTMKLELLVAVPPGVVTVIGPVVAPIGTETVSCVAELTAISNALTATPLKATALAPSRFVPVMTTEVSVPPSPGVKPAMVGVPEAVTVKLPLVAALPNAVVTTTGPVVAPAGTIAVISVDVLLVKLAGMPLNVTNCTLTKFWPVITTERRSVRWRWKGRSRTDSRR